MPGRTCDTVLCCSYILCRWNTTLCSNSFPTSSCIACRRGAISNRGVLGLFPSGVCGPAPFWACREAPGLDIFGWPDAACRACMYKRTAWREVNRRVTRLYRDTRALWRPACLPARPQSSGMTHPVQRQLPDTPSRRLRHAICCRGQQAPNPTHGLASGSLACRRLCRCHCRAAAARLYNVVMGLLIPHVLPRYR